MSTWRSLAQRKITCHSILAYHYLCICIIIDFNSNVSLCSWCRLQYLRISRALSQILQENKVVNRIIFYGRRHYKCGAVNNFIFRILILEDKLSQNLLRNHLVFFQLMLFILISYGCCNRRKL